MKNALPTLITRLPSKAHPRLVFACAWCPEQSQRKLQSNEVYTHGICSDHKQAFLASVHKRIEKIKKHAASGNSISFPAV